MKRYLQAAVMAFFIGCAAGCATSGKVIRVGGDEAAISGFIMPVKETFEEESGIALSINRSSAGGELVDLEKGTVEVIVATRSLGDLLHEAAQEKVVIDPASLQQVEIGKDTTVIFLHKSNRIRKLTKRQLKAIFTGKITNWRQVGGANRHIVVVWNPEAENDAFIKEILDGSLVASKEVPAESYEEVRARVIATPGSIGIAPRGFIARGVKVPKTPAVASPVIMVTKGEPSPGVKQLIDLLKDVAYIP